MWWNDGSGWWLIMPLLMLAFWVAVIWVVVILVRGRPAPSAGEGARPVAPEQIRAQRYARGELDDGEYRRRRCRTIAPMPSPSSLTPGETEVLRHVADGLTNAEIAERLVVFEETVKTHVSRTLARLGVRDRAQAIIVYESGLVVPRGVTPPQPPGPGARS
jgi:DNA-binding CsgD family transcriptional regulator